MSLRLGNDLAHLEAFARLAQREKACRPFFGLTIQNEAGSLALPITVPEDAAWLLGEFHSIGQPQRLFEAHSVWWLARFRRAGRCCGWGGVFSIGTETVQTRAAR